MGTAELHYLPRADRLLTAGERFEDLKEELAHDMRNAVKGMQSWVTTTVTAQGLSRYVETLQSAPEAVQTALEDDAVQDALKVMLDESRCLLVAALRQRLATFMFRELGESVLSALDNQINAASLMNVLRVSPCPKVDALRDAIVAAYVDGNAEKVFGARGVR